MADQWVENERLGGRITRRRFLGAISVGTAGIALTGTPGCEPAPRTRLFASPGRCSEFSCDGRLLVEADFPPAVEYCRASRFPWKGEPQTRPAVVAESREGGEVEVHVSWNGAREVATWQVLAGPGPDELMRPRQTWRGTGKLDRGGA